MQNGLFLSDNSNSEISHSIIRSEEPSPDETPIQKNVIAEKTACSRWFQNRSD